MKTIPVSLIVAGILAPCTAFAEGRDGFWQKDGPKDGEGRRMPERPFVDAWKAADKDQNGAISMDEFSAMPRIQNLPEEKRASLFKRFDKSGDGTLSRDEMGWMGGKGRDESGPPMQRLWQLDRDRSGGVSLDEFKAGQVFQKLPPEKQDALFSRLDTNKDGVISPQDRPEPQFKPDGGKNRPKHPDGGKPDGPPRMDPRQIIRQLDKNGDGALSFEEFRESPMVRNLTEDEQEDRFEEMDRNDDLKLTHEDFPAPPPREKPDRRPEADRPPVE